jgi:integrase
MPRKGSKPRKRKDGRWEYRFYVRGEDGVTLRRVSVFGRSAEEALKKGRELQMKHERGLVPAKDPRTFAAFAEAWLQRKAATKAAKTLANYRREVAYWLPYLGHMKLQTIKPADIRRALDALEARGVGPRSLKKALIHLRAIFREALALELVYRDPTAAIRLEVPSRGKAGRALEPEEAEALLRAFDSWPSWEVGMALRLCLALGLRAGEALGLKWGDLDFSEGTLAVRRAWTALGGKGALTEPKTPNAVRVLPVPQGTLARLEARRRELLERGVRARELKEAWVFPSPKDPSQPLNPHTLGHALRKITARLGLAPLRVHDLRHSYGSLLSPRGPPWSWYRSGWATGTRALPSGFTATCWATSAGPLCWTLRTC